MRQGGLSGVPVHALRRGTGTPAVAGGWRGNARDAVGEHHYVVMIRIRV